MNDIYFDKNYGRLYEEIEKGICEVFEYDNEYGKIKYIFIKREIPIELDNKKYYDTITPYGYGGPIIEHCIEGYKEKLIEEFFFEFEKYCISNNIVSEFVRFHPIYKNALDFMGGYDLIFDRKTIGTNLKDYDNPIEVEFSKACRRNIKKSFNRGLTFSVIEKPKSLDEFLDIYYSTMDRNSASDFYYFKKDYFDKCLEYFSNNILLTKVIYEEKTICMGIFFLYNNNIYVHLSGTDKEYMRLAPTYLLMYATALWGKENGYSLIHHGGGKTNSTDDTLYLFKKNFGVNTEFDFYVAKKIWNYEAYKKLCFLSNNDINIDFFPAYRNIV